MLTYDDLDRGDTFQCCYEAGDTYNSRFGAISSSVEECRADTCGFYLCTLPEVYHLFGFAADEIETLLWVNVMNQLRKGVLGL
jgi:dipeptidyl-peptidase-3